MQVVVLGNDDLKAELLQDTTVSGAELVWVADAASFLNYPNADAFIDLLYDGSVERKSILRRLPALVFINSVTETLATINEKFIRINGWPTFLNGRQIEAACLEEAPKEKAEKVFSQLGKEITWLPDVPGFVTPRVVSMIINEAFLALEEGVSTPAEIDTAMKLGTAYPYGPFEWSKKIGLQPIATLLQTLSTTQPRYTPAPLLLREVAPTI